MTAIATPEELDTLPSVTESASVVWVTPEYAAELLKLNKRNRRMRPAKVDAHVRALMSGQWEFNGGSVVISATERLLDGQHRLAAIQQSGYAAKMVVVTGVDDKAQVTIDTGSKRSFSDLLKMDGEKHFANLASVVRLYALMEIQRNALFWGRSNFQPQITELVRVLEEHPRLRESTIEAWHIYANVKLPISALGVAHYMFREIDPEDCRDFFDRLRSGTGIGSERTQAILKLRDWANSRKPHESRAQHVQFGTICKAWNAYRDGRAVGNIQLRTGGASPERFPWPK